MQSAKLHALMYSGMKESQEQSVRWHLTDVVTFHGFGQFVYTGAYKEAKTDPYAIQEQNTGSTKPTCELLLPNSDSHLWPRFKTLLKNPLGVDLEESWLPQSQAKKTGTTNLLGYAKIYVFAEYHGVEKLRCLSLWKLYKSLANYELTGGGLADITELVFYSFANTTKGDQLAGMIGLYAACHLDHLWKYEPFQDLVENADFFHSLIRVLLGSMVNCSDHGY